MNINSKHAPFKQNTEALKYALNALIDQWKLALFSVLFWRIAWTVGAKIAYVACHGSQFGAITPIKPTLGLEDNYIALIITNLLFGSPWGAYDYKQGFYYLGDPTLIFYSFLELWPVLVFCIIFIPLLVLCLDVGLKKAALQIYDTGRASIKTMITLPIAVLLKLAPFFSLIGCAQIGHFFLHNWLRQWTVFNILTPWIGWYLLLIIPLSYVSFRLAFVALFMIDQQYSLSKAIINSYQLTNTYKPSFWVYLWSFAAAWIFANTTVPAMWGALAIWILSFSETYMYRMLVRNHE